MVRLRDRAEARAWAVGQIVVFASVFALGFALALLVLFALVFELAPALMVVPIPPWFF